MAFFRVSVGVVAKSDGGSVRRRSAYVRGTTFDEFNFLHKASELQDNGILLPTHANDDYLDPEVLWSSVEATETAVNAVLGRTLEIAIPLEVPEDLHTKFATDMLQFIVDDYGLGIEWAIHKDWSEQLGRYTFHIHSTETTRGFGDDGLMTKKVNKDRKFKSLCSKSRATGGKILVRGVVSEQMNTWMDVHGIEAEVTHEAHDDRDLIIPDMPFNVRKVYQRWQEAVKDAELENNPTPDCPYYVQRYLDEISAVKELRAAKADLEKIRNQPESTWDQEAWETFNKPSPFISVVTTDVENTDEADVQRFKSSKGEDLLRQRTNRNLAESDKTASVRDYSSISGTISRRSNGEHRTDVGEDERRNRGFDRQPFNRRDNESGPSFEIFSSSEQRDSSSPGYSSNTTGRRITVRQLLSRNAAAKAASSILDSIINIIKTPLPKPLTVRQILGRNNAARAVSSTLDDIINTIEAPLPKPLTVRQILGRNNAARAVSSTLDDIINTIEAPLPKSLTVRQVLGRNNAARAVSSTLDGVLYVISSPIPTAPSGQSP